MLIKTKLYFFHLIFFLVLSVGFFWTNLYYWLILVFNLCFVLSVYSIKSILSNNKKFLYFIPVLLFLNATYLFLSLMLSKFLILFFLLVSIVFSFYYFKNLKRALTRKSEHSFINLFFWLDILGFLSVFLLSSFLYSLTHFLNWGNHLIFLLIALSIFLLAWQNIFIVNTNNSKNLLSLFLFLALILPLAWVLFLLPFSANILALFLTVFYYSALSFIRYYLSKSLSNKKIKYNLIFIISLLVFIFLMLKWR